MSQQHYQSETHVTKNENHVNHVLLDAMFDSLESSTVMYDDTSHHADVTYHISAAANGSLANISMGMMSRSDIEFYQNAHAVNRYILLGMSIITFFVGTMGNFVTVWVIYRHPSMRNVASVFICCLAIADGLLILNLPIMIYATFDQTGWRLGTIICKLMNAALATNLFASIYTMVAMSVDRYVAVLHPLRSMSTRTSTKAMWVCFMIWIMCVILQTPYYLYSRTITSQNGKCTCRVQWPSEDYLTYKEIWTWVELVVGFVIPIVIITFTYGSMWYNVRYAINRTHLHRTTTRKSNVKLTLMLAAVTIVFVVCWIPYHAAQLHHVYFSKHIKQTRRIPHPNETLAASFLNTAAQSLVFISSCVNPFIYAISSKNFRRSYKECVCSCCYDIRGDRFTLHRSSTYQRRNREFKRRKHREALTWFGSSRRKKVPVSDVPAVIVGQDVNLQLQPPLHQTIDTIRNEHAELANGELCAEVAKGPSSVPQDMDMCASEVASDEERQCDTAV